MNERKAHWDNVYETKSPEQVSWTQERPDLSLKFIEEVQLKKDAKIIDIGGGDSKLVDHLLKAGYTDITILDISEKALLKAKNRLGTEAEKIKWIVSDINDFEPNETYDLWHDRAVFHFITEEELADRYCDIVSRFAKNMIIATFSKTGPLKCSGLEIKQYDVDDLKNKFQKHFNLVNHCKADHLTPFETTQNFTYCLFKAK